MTVKKINHTGISVSDMDLSLTFYRDLLGLEVIFDSKVQANPRLSRVVGMDGARGRVVWLRVAESMIELWQWDYPKGRSLPADYKPADHGVTHFGLEVEDVDDLCNRVKEAGYHINTTPQDLGLHKTTYIKGPDNEIIEILENRATDGWLRELTEQSARQQS